MPGRDSFRGTNLAALVQNDPGIPGASSQHDALTGLPARSLFQSILLEAIARGEHGLAMLRLSVDDVATLRQDHGLGTADALLAAVAGRLRRSIRGGDVAGRIRDFDFALLMVADDVAEAACAAQRVLERLREPYEVSGKLIDIVVSIGIAYAGIGESNADLLNEHSDIALERARASGRSEWKIFRGNNPVDPHTQSAMIADLHAALEKGEMSIAYEPSADIRGLRLRGSDAVLQWDHNKIGLIRSTDFLPVINDREAARLLADWTIEEVCRETSQLKLALPVTVLLDRSIVPDDRFVEVVRNALSRHRVEPKLLWIGLPHRTLSELSEDGLQALRALREFGVKISVDDYADIATLQELRTLPIDGIRTSASILEDLITDIHAFVRVQALTGLASNLSIPVCAKGVSTDEELETVRRFGFTFVHGPILGGTLSVPEIVAHARADLPMTVRQIPRI